MFRLILKIKLKLMSSNSNKQTRMNSSLIIVVESILTKLLQYVTKMTSERINTPVFSVYTTSFILLLIICLGDFGIRVHVGSLQAF